MADGLVGITRRYSALGQGRRRAVEPFNINGQWDSEDQGYKWACPELRDFSQLLRVYFFPHLHTRSILNPGDQLDCRRR